MYYFDKAQRSVAQRAKALARRLEQAKKTGGKGRRDCNTDEAGTGGTGGQASLSLLIFRLIDQFIFFDPGHHVSQLRADRFNLMS
jgi:hypothetical protein